MLCNMIFLTHDTHMIDDSFLLSLCADVYRSTPSFLTQERGHRFFTARACYGKVEPTNCAGLPDGKWAHLRSEYSPAILRLQDPGE
jgi:hypothetical protein